MTEVLLVSYFSKNDDLVGGRRMSSLKEFLTEKGYNVKILTRNPVSSNDIKSPWNQKKSIFDKFIIPDFTKEWSKKSFDLIKDKQFDVIITSSPPMGVHFLGFLYKLKYPNVKWIMDYRDPFTLNVSKRKIIIQHQLQKLFEKRLLKKVDLVIQNSSVDLQKFNFQFPQYANKTIFIRNGIEKILPISNSEKLTNRIIYCGGLYKNDIAYLGIKNFLEILNNKGIQLECDWYGGDISKYKYEKIHFKGLQSPDNIYNILNNYKLSIGYLPKEAIGSGRVLQKFYDYLGARTIPIVLNASKEIFNLSQDLEVLCIPDEDQIENYIDKIIILINDDIKMYQRITNN